MQDKNYVYRLVMMLGVLSVSIAILWPFAKSIAWAVLLAISLWPVYQVWKKPFKGFQGLSAFLFTILVAAVVVLPLAWVIYVAGGEFATLVAQLEAAHRAKSPLPSFLQNLPYVNHYMNQIWQQYVIEPKSLGDVVKHFSIPFFQAKVFVLALVEHSITFIFMLLVLFFCFLDGAVFSNQIHGVMHRRIDNFNQYIVSSIKAIRSVIECLIYIGVFTGVIMGVVYWILGAPLPAFFAFATGLATIIPFAVVAIILFLGFFFFVAGCYWKALVLCMIGIGVNLFTDNWMRPIIIGRSVSMHFLATLLGVLGGVKLFGLIGIYLGPVFLVVMTVIWKNAFIEAHNA